MSKTKCPECAKHNFDTAIKNPKCAFETGTFSSDNFHCQTALAVRELMESEKEGIQLTHVFDAHYGTINVDEIYYRNEDGEEEGVPAVALFVSWYKQRGCQPQLRLMDFSEEEPALPTLTQVLAILKHYKNK